MGLLDFLRRRPAPPRPRITLEAGLEVVLLGEPAEDGEAARRLFAEARESILERISALRANYLEEDEEPASGWDELVDPCVRVTGEASFELSCSFRWQHPDDGHLITLVVENGVVVGEEIDG